MSAARPRRLVAVVDCGMGNIHSLLGCLRRLAPQDRIEFTADAALIADADCVFLPGDGAFGAYVEEIDRRGLREVLVSAANERPFFGICVGMQVLFEGCDEGEGAGLGVLPGRVVRFPDKCGSKIPLMGWLDVKLVADEHPFLLEVKKGSRYYFLHSYFVQDNSEYMVMIGNHTTRFAAAVSKNELIASQFHPEKSSVAGMQIIKNFLKTI